MHQSQSAGRGALRLLSQFQRAIPIALQEPRHEALPRRGLLAGGSQRAARVGTLALVAAAGLALAACKIVPTAEVKAQQSQAAAFDPDRMVADVWDTKALPALAARAGPFPEVIALVRSASDEAGKRYGHREQASAPWTYAAKIEGRIVAADTGTRAATIGVDTDGDSKPDATVQIGPVIRGTALRDALDFVSFNDFSNQTDFARFGKAFNQHVDRDSLSKLPRDGLVGRSVTVLGVFQAPGSGEPPLVTPAEITLGPTS